MLAFKQKLKEACSSIKNYIKRAKTSNTTDDSGVRPLVQVKYFVRKIKTTHLLFPFGVSANPKTGTEVVLFNIMGQEENTFAIPYATLDRLKDLLEGEVAIGSPDFGNFIKFTETGIVINDDISQTGNVAITGNITNTGDITSSGEVAGATLNAGDGFTGSFTVNVGANTATVVNGIIVSVI